MIMKTKIFLVVSILTFTFQQAFSQDYIFKVVASKGQNKLGKTTLKVGNTLQQGEKVTIAKGGYLGLAHWDGKTIEIDESGTYLVDDLNTKIEVEGKGTISKYLDYVLSETTQTTSHSVLKTRYSYMAKPAGVKRNDAAILFYLPNSAKVLGKEAFISWYVNDSEPEVIKKYKLSIHDEFGEFLDEYIVEGNSTFLNLYTEKLKEHRMLTYKIIALADPTFISDKQLFFKMSQKASKNYDDYEILSEGETALDKIILAKFFEEKGLVVDAMTAYQQAMSLAPEVEAYHKLYDDFLKRAKIMKEHLRE